MNQYDFDKLLEKYIHNECTLSEQKLLDEWADKQLTFAENADKSYKPTKSQGIKIFDYLKNKYEDRSSAYFSKKNLKYIYIVLIFSVIAALYFYNFRQEKEVKEFALSEQLPLLKFKNNSKDVQKISLPDGSEVDVDPKSEIWYPSNFGLIKREVQLLGNAFFQVKKDSVPFFVYSSGLTTEVLGTSFRIQTNLNKNITEVEVASGIVKVYKSKDVNTLDIKKHILKTNHKAVYDRKENNVIQTLTEDLVEVVPLPPKIQFNFSDEPVVNILNLLQKTYGIEIYLVDKALTNCTFTGDLNDLKPMEIIKLMAKVLKATVEIEETKIIIAGDGCK
jgi:hypothetical protein